MISIQRYLVAILVFFLASCASPSPANIEQFPVNVNPNGGEASSPSITDLPSTSSELIDQPSLPTVETQTLQESVEPSATNDNRQLAEDWQNWPVIPQISPWLRKIYAQGLADGNDPHKFSKIGDCQNVVSLFLPFDLPP
ncbi:MAG: hypothetical protein ABIJ65_11265, partial [Chloroflexota bacterium]